MLSKPFTIEIKTKGTKINLSRYTAVLVSDLDLDLKELRIIIDNVNSADGLINKLALQGE